MKYLFIWLFLFSMPAVSQAAVVINEVAWMGNSVSANDEWIELYNDGSQGVGVDGWVLTDGMSLHIELAGSVAAGQYAVLERTDDSSAQGTAFLIYAGALSNAGASLSLYRADNTLEDRVVGGENWEGVGGDNTTKETAQYTTAGWITAQATPGGVNNTEPEDDPIEEDAVQQEQEDDVTSNAVSTLYTVPRALHVSIDVPSRVYVHQAVPVEVTATGLASGILNALTHEWNFGDFTTDSGQEVVHRFEYPGEYVVTVQSQYKDYEAYARKTVVVLPVSFSLTTNVSGDVQVHNDARYEVDVSGYKIAAGKTLRFPEGTILLPNATITLPREKLQFINSVTLFDDTATQVASIVPVSAPEEVIASKEVVSPVPVAYAPLVEPSEASPEGFTFVGDMENTGDTEAPVQEAVEVEPQMVNTEQLAAPIEAAQDIPDGTLPYFALLAVIGLGVTAVFAGSVKS